MKTKLWRIYKTCHMIFQSRRIYVRLTQIPTSYILPEIVMKNEVTTQSTTHPIWPHNMWYGRIIALVS